MKQPGEIEPSVGVCPGDRRAKRRPSTRADAAIAAATHHQGRDWPVVGVLAVVAFVAFLAPACGTQGSSPTGTGGNGGPMSGAGGTTAGPAGHPGPGGPGAAGAMGPGAGGNGGSGGVAACVPGVQQTIVTDCGYPSTTSNILSSTVFNESDVLRAIQPSGSAPGGIVRVFYNDEHALTLGVRSVAVKTAGGTTTTSYPVASLASDPGSAVNPQTGSNVLSGDQSGLDVSLRPMWPSLFLTDVSSDPTSRVGDWQQGGRPLGPSAIFGTWKAAVRTVDETVTPNSVAITPDADPAKNDWSLGSADTVPQGLSNEGFGAEVVWNVTLVTGHSYRVQVIVHDGDQNKAGGDSGEACVLFCSGGGSESNGGTCGSQEGCGSTGAGGSSGGQCPSGTTSCGQGGIDPATCPSGTVCANGCCLPTITVG